MSSVSNILCAYKAKLDTCEVKVKLEPAKSGSHTNLNIERYEYIIIFLRI